MTQNLKNVYGAVHRCFFEFDSVPDKNKAYGIRSLVLSLYFVFIVYCHYQYVTQEMCDEAVNDSLATLKLIVNWFVTNKMIKNLFTALHADENIPF